MPSAWSLIDASFPTFTGDERVRDQMSVVLNYMFMLAEGLKYQLSNLNAQNFNSTALKNIQIETTADVEEALEQLIEELSTVKNSVSSLRTSVGSLEKWQESASAQLSELDEAQKKFDENQTEFSNQLVAIQAFVGTNEEGIPTIGTKDGTLHLIGKIYINGTLVE